MLPYFHRYFFRATGSVYLGPMVTCLVLVMLTSNSLLHPPVVWRGGIVAADRIARMSQSVRLC